MKNFITALFLLGTLNAFAQKVENIIIITTDGFRWQEVFGGWTVPLPTTENLTRVTVAVIYKKYWAADPVERRKKLIAFFMEHY